MGQTKPEFTPEEIAEVRQSEALSSYVRDVSRVVDLAEFLPIAKDVGAGLIRFSSQLPIAYYHLQRGGLSELKSALRRVFRGAGEGIMTVVPGVTDAFSAAAGVMGRNGPLGKFVPKNFRGYIERIDPATLAGDFATVVFDVVTLTFRTPKAARRYNEIKGIEPVEQDAGLPAARR